MDSLLDEALCLLEIVIEDDEFVKLLVTGEKLLCHLFINLDTVLLSEGPSAAVAVLALEGAAIEFLQIDNGPDVIIEHH